MPLPENPQWAIDYAATLHLFESDKFLDAILAAKQNLTDKRLGRYWQIKNCLVIASLETDWNEAEEIRLIAEDVYKRAENAASCDDEVANQRLSEVRSHLDALRQDQLECEPAGRDEMDEEVEVEEAQERDRSEEPDVVKIISRTLQDVPYYPRAPFEDSDEDMASEESEGEKEERKAVIQELQAEFRQGLNDARRDEADALAADVASGPIGLAGNRSEGSNPPPASESTLFASSDAASPKQGPPPSSPPTSPAALGIPLRPARVPDYSLDADGNRNELLGPNSAEPVSNRRTKRSRFNERRPRVNSNTFTKPSLPSGSMDEMDTDAVNRD